MHPNAVLYTALLVFAQTISAQQIDGMWYGTADEKPDQGLPVSLRLALKKVGDSVRVELTLPESRLVRLRVPSEYSDSTFATYRGGQLHIEFTPDIGLAVISGFGPRENERIVFRGRLDGADRLVGSLTITSYTSRITLRRERVPEHREIPVRFRSKYDSLTLGGTLLLPANVVRPQVVIFVTGSDPDTRDAWRYEATELAKKGTASLLYDKRGVGESSGASHDLASWDDLAGDVEGAITFLLSRPDLVDTARIGAVGQSQGTWIIAKVAAENKRVRFMVNISGSGISAAAQETYRTTALMRAAGFSEDEITRAAAFQRQKFRVARYGVGWEALDSTIKKLRADSVKWFPGYGTGAGARSLVVLRLYGVLQFNYDPTTDLERITIPTFTIMGERDRVFPPPIVVERMQQAQQKAGNRCIASRIVPDATHGLSVTQTYRGRPFRRAISPEFLDLLVGWISARQLNSC